MSVPMLNLTSSTILETIIKTNKHVKLFVYFSCLNKTTEYEGKFFNDCLQEDSQKINLLIIILSEIAMQTFSLQRKCWSRCMGRPGDWLAQGF